MIWSRQYMKAASDLASAVAADRNGDVYVAGHTEGAFARPTGRGGDDMILLKLVGGSDLPK